MLQTDAIDEFHSVDFSDYQASIAWRNYFSLAAFLFLVLDYGLLLRTEVKYIWRSEFRLSKGLYIFSRYTPLCIQIINYTFVHKWLLHYPISTIRCQAWFWILELSCSALVIAMDCILVLRIYALYLKNKKILFLVIPLIGEHVLAAVVMFRSTIVNPSFSGYCDLNKTPITVVALGSLTFLSHVGLWGAIYSKRKVSQAAVLSLVVKESHWTLVLFMISVFFFIPWSFHFKTNPFIIFVWPITIISVTSCRIVLNMLKLKTESPSNPQSISTTDFLFSTILDSTRTRDSDELNLTQLSSIGFRARHSNR